MRSVHLNYFVQFEAKWKLYCEALIYGFSGKIGGGSFLTAVVYLGKKSVVENILSRHTEILPSLLSDFFFK